MDQSCLNRSGNLDHRLIKASEHGNFFAVKRLLSRGANVNAADDMGRTPLDGAVYSGARMAVSALIEAGADLNAVDHCGVTALYRACWQGDTEMARLLLEAGANPNIILPPPNGDTILHAAAEAGRRSTVKLAIKVCHTVDPLNSCGWSPLFVAVIYDKLRVLPLLIKAGAEVNIRDEWGVTPLHVALENESARAARLLIKAGADMHIPNSEGVTAMDILKSESTRIYGYELFLEK